MRRDPHARAQRGEHLRRPILPAQRHGLVPRTCPDCIADDIDVITLRRARRTTRQSSARSLESGMKIIAKLALATLVAPVALTASEAAAQKLTFTLNWVAGGDHAPYFYAQKMGLYKQAGLDVDFETGRGSAASAQKVGAGQSQLGLSDMAGVQRFPGNRGPGLGGVEVLGQFPPG